MEKVKILNLKKLIKKTQRRQKKKDYYIEQLKIAQEQLDYEQILKLKKRTFQIKQKDIDSLKNTLTILGMDCVFSQYESDQVLAQLQKKNQNSIILSSDSDILTHGGQQLVVDFKTSGRVFEICLLDKILQETKFSMQQFTEFCVLCGTDYNTSIPGIGPITAFNLIQKFNSLTNEKLQQKLQDQYKFKYVNNLIEISKYFNQKQVEFEHKDQKNEVDSASFKEIYQDLNYFTEQRSDRMMKQLSLIEEMKQEQKDILEFKINQTVKGKSSPIFISNYSNFFQHSQMLQYILSFSVFKLFKSQYIF